MIGYLVMAHLYAVLKIILWDWKDGLEVKSTDCSSRGPEFDSQQPHGGSQLSIMGSSAHTRMVCLKTATVSSHI